MIRMIGKTVICLMLAFAYMMPQVMAAPVPVKVRGTSLAGDTVRAQQDAQRNAVYRVLSTMLDGSDKNNPVVKQIMDRYQEYTGKVTVSRKFIEANKLYLNATVMVDTDKLRNAVQNSVAKEQKAHRDGVSTFLIRVVDENGKNRPNDMIQNIYEMTYINHGFKTKNPDVFRIFVGKCNEDYAGFIQQMTNKVHDEMNVKMAVIGEVRIVKCQETAKTFDLEAKVQLKALDMVNNGKVFADFAEDYSWVEVKDVGREKVNEQLPKMNSHEQEKQGREKAIKHLLYKAAMNSSSYLAEQTLAYWNK